MRTAINITGELKYILDNKEHHVVVPFHTLQASELIKQDVELINHDYSVALYGFRYEAETSVGTFRYFFLVEHSMAGFRPYAIYHDLPENVKPLRDTIDFSLQGIVDPPQKVETKHAPEVASAETLPLSFWRQLCQKYLPDSRLDKDQRRQQRRGGRLLVALAIACAVLWALAHLKDKQSFPLRSFAMQNRSAEREHVERAIRPQHSHVAANTVAGHPIG